MRDKWCEVCGIKCPNIWVSWDRYYVYRTVSGKQFYICAFCYVHEKKKIGELVEEKVRSRWC